MRFKKIYIEITNTCNLTCSFCVQNQRKEKMMSIEQFEHIIAQIQPYTKYVYLHVLGEPLSHPNLGAFLRICDEANIQVNLTTNGTLLAQKEDCLYDAKIRQINVSLHSFPQHIQENYIANVFRVCERLAKRGVYINYRLWSLDQGTLTKETEVILHQLVEKYGIDIHMSEVKTHASICIQERMYVHFEDIFEWPTLANSFVGTKGTCLGMRSMCAVLSDGSVVPCCLDSKAECLLGNVFEQPFSEIMESKLVQDIKEGFLKQEVHAKLCQHCQFRLRFL